MGQTGQFFEIESPVGLIATTDDDFVYNKGKFDNNWNNDFSVGVGTQHLIDFLVNNKDPRLLYFFQKNDYNSNVVQAYFDQKREMPDRWRNTRIILTPQDNCLFCTRQLVPRKAIIRVLTGIKKW